MPTTTNFPLSWESTGDQWWYAAPIDWAAANGLCDLVKELLHIDPNLLIKLTSLRRTRRLETVWEDGLEPDNNEVAHCRASVARALLMDCEPRHGDGLHPNSLMRAGYGGWLLYTAASAGDIGFVKDLLERDSLLVFGEGEYGVTDILYAAARSKDSEIFRLLLESAMNANKGSGEVRESFVREMMNRAVHAAARGGNIEVVKELLLDFSDISGYRDAQGCTILHSASGRGQLEVVKDLIATYSCIINSTDNQGNTALHTAAYRGYSSVVEVLAVEASSLTTARNNDGNTFLHMAVAGFQSPGFHRIDQQFELIRRLTSGKIISLIDIVNIRNKEGRTALHIAVTENIQCNVVELLMRVPSINLNIRDIDGLTPLDLLKQCPKSATSNILIKQLASAGGISDCQDYTARTARATQLRIQGIRTSPGTSFSVPDSELFFPLVGDGNDSEISREPPSSRFSSCSSEVTSHFGSENNKKTSRLLKLLLKPDMNPITPTKSPDPQLNFASTNMEGHNDVAMFKVCRNADDSLTTLRQKFSKAVPSHSAREKFAASLMKGVVQATPPKSCLSLAHYSPSSLFYESLASSPITIDKVIGDYEGKNVGRSSFLSGPLSGGKSLVGDNKHRRVSSFNKSLMNQYFCFGAQGLAVEDSVSCRKTNTSCRRLVF